MKNSILHLFRYCKEYGIKCTLAFYLCMLFPCSEIKIGGWRKKLLIHKHNTIASFLYRHYPPAMDQGNEKELCANNHSDSIWTAWLQGEENAPDVIRITLASKRIFANGHPVIVITADNVNQYIEIPQSIQEKYESGIMSHAHYADVIRMLILAKYGGVWLDATAFLHEPIKEEAFHRLFYSMGYRDTDEGRFVSKRKWLIGFIGGSAGSMYLASISDMLSRYWKEHEIAIDYFVFDYFIYILYQNNPSFHMIVDNLPKMDHNTYMLQRTINYPYNEETLKRLYSEGQIYILTYREQYERQTLDGHLTFYGYLYDQYFEYKAGRQ